MNANQLHVIAVIYNPIRWESRIRLFRLFEQHMLDSGVLLTVVECQLGQRPFELDGNPNVEHIGVRAETLAWNKECLVNIGVARSKYKTPYIAWIDADVEFRNRTWASDTVHALQQYNVVQPWGDGLDLGPKGEPMFIKGFHVQTSFAKVWQNVGKIEAIAAQGAQGPYAAGWAYPHPGYAWAIRRDVLKNIGGLIEVSGLGAGDHQMAMSFIGNPGGATHGGTTPEYQAVILAWATRAYKYVQGHVGYVPGTVEHAFHGVKDKRLYVERWQTLINFKFNPITDLKKNLDGVVELAGNKPGMAQEFDRYFRQRDEDSNTL